MCPRRRTPSEAAVPMKSNTTRYGPQAFKGPPGQVHFVADDGLTPWEYAGYTNLMNGSPNVMTEHARSAVTYMQEGERGSINFPGHPTRRLGAELRSAQQVMSFLSIQNDTFKVLNQSFDLKKIDIGAWAGAFGPNITNIQINIGENGFTTNYTLSTFSPSFGRFAKYNANRLKIIGRQRTSFLKAQRERNKLARALRAAETRTSRSLKDMKNKRQSKQDAPNANTIKTGGMGQGKSTNGNMPRPPMGGPQNGTCVGKKDLTNQGTLTLLSTGIIFTSRALLILIILIPMLILLEINMMIILMLREITQIYQ